MEIARNAPCGFSGKERQPINIDPRARIRLSPIA
jgi:hypothetical protein